LSWSQGIRRLFVDTGAWFAFLNRSDPDHSAVAELLASHSGRLLTSNYVFDETVTLTRVRLGYPAAVQIGAALLDPRTVDLVRLTAADEVAAWDLFRSREDKGYSFTDCTSFVLLRRLGLEIAAALDRHFEQEGFRAVPG
jgi:uncharacterized protein